MTRPGFNKLFQRISIPGRFVSVNTKDVLRNLSFSIKESGTFPLSRNGETKNKCQKTRTKHTRGETKEDIHSDLTRPKRIVAGVSLMDDVLNASTNV